MSRVSVITINRGRGAHLVRLLQGLARGQPPDECVVVTMGQDDNGVPDPAVPIQQVALPGDGLPLAEARNRGREAATGEALVFLDVDCIPSSSLVAGLQVALAEHDGLVCCEIRYLPGGAVSDGWTESELSRLGHPHPARTFPAVGIEPAEHPGLFWSLAFGIRASAFDRIGGFDPGFIGYGAEDTDFAYRAAAAGVPILFAGGMRAFHQRHTACDPPLQHFADIVRNARRFKARHGTWPMAGWLDAFAARGLIAPEREQDLVILRSPTPEEITAAQLADDRPF